MNRREFIAAAGSACLGSPFAWEALSGEPARAKKLAISWHRAAGAPVFAGVEVEGVSLLDPSEGVGVCDGFCSLLGLSEAGSETVVDRDRPRDTSGPIHVSIAHTLERASEAEDLLVASLTLENRSDRAMEVSAGFLSGIRAARNGLEQQVYVPLSAAGLRDAADDPRRRMKDCRQQVGKEGFLCHYLEPQASDPRHATTRAALLAPVLDLIAKDAPCRAAWFGRSDEPMFFEALQGKSGRAWRLGRRIRLAAGQTVVVRGWLLLHAGDASTAWAAFHRFGHREDHPPLSWPREVRVHYFDFLSAVEANGPRGGGYDADLARFADFHVGMATQHGYYLSYGDFVHPDRKEWRAMPNDAAGPVAMSLEKIRARVDATRRAGVRPAIYLHYSILDEGSPLFDRMRDAILIDAEGKPSGFGWEGPDVIKKTWRMSHNAPQWRDHLVRQAQWVMELFNPDAIVLDETFTAWGYDHHPSHGGPLSTGGIDLMRRLRAVVRSFGPDKALFASDCSMANFCLWGDGEGGDHCYDRLLGHELYRRPPVRYLAALGNKAWLPCAWLYRTLWASQVDLAKTAGAAVGVTNGWGDSFGLTRLPAEDRERMLRDIRSLAASAPRR